MAMAHDLRRSIWHESDVKTMVRVFAMALTVRCKRAHILLHIVEIQIHLKVESLRIDVLFCRCSMTRCRTCTRAQRIRSIIEITFARET
jgi:hypothetical protein